MEARKRREEEDNRHAIQVALWLEEESKRTKELCAKRKLERMENPEWKESSSDSDSSDSDDDVYITPKKAKVESIEEPKVIEPIIDKVIMKPIITEKPVMKATQKSAKVYTCKAIISGNVCNKPVMEGSRTACSKSCKKINDVIRQNKCRTK